MRRTNSIANTYANFYTITFSFSNPEPTLTPTPTPSPGDAVLEGDALLRISDFEGAIEAYERAIAIDESYGRAYSGLSQVYIWQGIRSDDALANAQKGVELGTG